MEEHPSSKKNTIIEDSSLKHVDLDNMSDLEVNKQTPHNSANSQNNLVPEEGMEFDSLEDADFFYKQFAKRNGFDVRIRTSRSAPRSKELIGRVYVCSREGLYKSKSCENDEAEEGKIKIRRTSSTNTIGCQAKFTVLKLKKDNKWVVTNSKDEHNHAMVSPRSTGFLKGEKRMSNVAKSLVKQFKEEGLPPGKVASLFNDTDQNFSARDCYNYLAKLKRKNLDVGDANAVLCYFKKKHAENPNFFYAIHCDDETRLVNIFWVDARSRLAYEYFGDAITFDTTYKTNKYSMSFAPFVGLNHHCQSILFGCALLQDESEESFIWLFNTWLEAMHGKMPISIITDQDFAIGAAVKKVFPTSRHRLCLWHIKKKFLEKLAHVYHKKSEFKRKLKGCIYEISSVEEFERKWHDLMVDNDLQNNEWLQNLYQIRELWILIYNRSTFFAGMNTTQRSESINYFFDGFVNFGTPLQEFVRKYEKALNTRYNSEKKEDYESRYKSRGLKIGSEIENQAASIYTKNIFFMFQDELIESNLFTKSKVEKTGSYYRYMVAKDNNPHEKFLVSLDLVTKVASCECHLFEFKGILCRHILAIFHFKVITEIPNLYILPRWTREANSGCRILESAAGFKGDNLASAALRVTHFYCHMNRLASLVEKSENAYDIIMKHVEQLYTEIPELEDSQTVEGQNNKSEDEDENQAAKQKGLGGESTDVAAEDLHCSLPLNIADPHISQTKGRKKDGVKESRNERLKGGLEASLASKTTKKELVTTVASKDIIYVAARKRQKTNLVLTLKMIVA